MAGESVGEGPAIVLVHGLTATRRYVVHNSRLLPRRGYRLVSYDARGHGESDPAPVGTYTYAELAADLAAVVDAQVADGRALLAGHSMGAHTALRLALETPDRLAGVVAIGPAYPGTLAPPEELREWDDLADGLSNGGVEGFLRAYERGGIDPKWRDTMIRITRERLSLHRHPEAVAQALREVPRSPPFETLDELEFMKLPALVVASHDQADPGHPRALAEEYAARLPEARLIGERQGESPLAWQGGRLSREIAAFCDEGAVRERVTS